MALEKGPSYSNCNNAACNGKFTWHDGELYVYPDDSFVNARSTNSNWRCFWLQPVGGVETVDNAHCTVHAATVICMADTCLPDNF